MESPEAIATLFQATDQLKLIVSGYAGCAIQLTGTWVGTVAFEGSVDGATFVALQVTSPTSGATVTSATGNGVWLVGTTGLRIVRARMSAYTSGVATVSLKAAQDSSGGASSGGGGGGGAVTVADGADVAEGATTDAAVTTDTDGTVSGKLRGLVKWAYERMPAALGQDDMAGSLPVVIASDQSAIDVNIVGGGGSGGTSSNFGDAFPAAGTAIGISDPSGDMEPLSAETLDYDTGAGTVLQTVIGIALPANGGPVAGGTTTNPLQVGDAGGSITVDGTVAATQSGTWNIGTVTAVTAISNALPAGNNNIGDVDVASVVPGTAATNLGKAEDAAHTSGDVGVMALVVRQDSQSAFGADGDYVPMSVDNAGGLRVSIVAGAGSGGTASADDADFTAGTTLGTPAMGVFESSPTSVTDGDLGIVGITAARRLKTSATVDAALPAGTNNIGDVDVLSVVPGTGATNLGKAEDAAHASGDTGVMALGVANNLQITLAGTDGDYCPIGTDLKGNVRVIGNIPDGEVDTGSPIKIGAIAYSPDGTSPGTAVNEFDRTNAKADLDGRLLTNPYHPTTKTVHLDGSSAYTDQALIADPGDGFQTVITNIIASTGAATALNFFLEEGSTKIFGPIYLEAVAGRGFCSGPIYLPCTASTAVTLTSSAAIAQSYQVQYFTQAV
jgi:hypothetical protein